MDPMRPQYLDINVLSVKGIDGNALIAELVPALLLEHMTDSVSSSEIVDGRDVTKIDFA